MEKPRPSTGELFKIKQDIQKQADLVRQLKDSTANQGTLATRAEVLKEVTHLLELKVLDPDVYDAEPKLFEAKVLKIRWHVPDSANGSTRVQFKFANKTSISGNVVWDTIQRETTRKYPSLGNVVSIQKREADDKKTFVDMSKEENFTLPLVFPGPLFKNEHVFDFKVNWDGTPPAPPKPRAKVFLD
eukprot:Phypoly_transcript_14616.p1 GENE.Phypoly_transcript_14616~~Phypoly_transcript_14616.p1  ORF type:complete len:187 (-),score=37.60 Phypoly_transcript_14616:79-639(-)